MTTFITGDRSAVVFDAIAVEMLRAVANGETIVTGDQPGTETVVRALGDAAGLVVDVVPSTLTDEGKPDWDARHTALADDVHVRFIHTDPTSSRIGASLVSTLPDERVTFVLQEAVLNS